MKAAIITVAGISSRFNEGIPEQNKELKAIYPKEDREATLLHHLLEKCSFADRIAVVDNGHIDAVGTHAELLEKSAVYRDICDSQERKGGAA